MARIEAAGVTAFVASIARALFASGRLNWRALAH
jgi:hypothetical protein